MTTTQQKNKTVESPKKYVYAFGTHSVSPPLEAQLLGKKGLGLAEMTAIGIPVPPGFIITSSAYKEYTRLGKFFTTALQNEILQSIRTLEKATRGQFGCERRPLLISVRPSMQVSMPGMMDAILNLGLNDQSVLGFAKESGDERLAYDNYRRFITMYSDVVQGIDCTRFDKVFQALKMQEGAELDIDLSVDGLKEACSQFKKIYEHASGNPFPQDARHQLFEAIKAIFVHWDSEQCIHHRQIHQYQDHCGTAIVVQMMVFGNKNDHSATGVGFTRNPSTGERRFYGEFLFNAQGEEVVAGFRQAHPISIHQKEAVDSHLASLEEAMPEVYQQLLAIVEQLEKYYKEAQDIEFTIEDGKLYLLETRTAKKTAFAAVRIAVEMLEEGLIDEKSALQRISPMQLAQLLTPVFSSRSKEAAKEKLVAKGTNAGPGAISGKLVFSAEKAIALKSVGIPSILVREESSADDLPAIAAADGILTLQGGSTCPSAIAARSMSKPYIVGCGSLHLNETAKTLSMGSLTLHEEDPISIDGNSGEVYFCGLETSASEIVQVLMTKEKKPEESLLYRQYQKIMELAEKYRASNQPTSFI